MEIPRHNFICLKEIKRAETLIEFNLSRHLGIIQYNVQRTSPNIMKHPSRINHLPTKPSPKHYLDLKKYYGCACQLYIYKVLYT